MNGELKFYWSEGSFTPLNRDLLSAEYYDMICAINNGYQKKDEPSYKGSLGMFCTNYIGTDKNNRLYSYKDYIRFDAPIIIVRYGLFANLEKYCRYHRSLKVLRTLPLAQFMMVIDHRVPISYFHPIKYMPIKLGDIKVQGFKQLKRKKRS